MWVSIDSSTWSDELAHDRGAKVVRRLRAVGANLFLAPTALYEIADGAGGLDRLDRLLEVARAMGAGRVRMGVEMHTLFVCERRGLDGLLTEPYDVGQVLQELIRLDDSVRTNRLAERLARLPFREFDESARSRALALADGIPLEELDRIMAPEVMRSCVFGLGPYPLRLVDEPARLRRLRRNPLRHRAALMSRSWHFLKLVGAAFRSHGRYVSVLRAKDGNDWNDARIATESAYVDVVVTTEEKMRARLALIAERFLLPQRCAGAEWLSSTSA